MADQVKKYFCPRLLDYIIMVGPREHSQLSKYENQQPSAGQSVGSFGKHNNRIPHLLRRYPPDDHEDFALPPDVVIFCQPEGCDHVESSLNAYNNPSQTTNSFVFLLTEKDTSRIRYGVCLNFYRPLQKCPPEPVLTGAGQQQHQHHQSAECQHQASLPIEQTLNALQSSGLNEEKFSQSSRDNEIGIKVSTGPTDSDSVASSQDRVMKNSRNNHQQEQHRHHHHQRPQTLMNRRLDTTSALNKRKSKITYALNSICIISHHPFFSTFRECLYIMKKFVQACEERHSTTPLNRESENQLIKCKCYLKQLNRNRRGSQQSQMSQGSRRSQMNTMNNHHYTCPYSNPIWALLTMTDIDDLSMPKNIISDVAEIEAWILRLLSVPVPVPGQTKVELDIMPSSLKQPLLFALPDLTRLSLIDFPLHLPLELLGVETCLQVLTCILLEHKVAIQSKDYNALSMSVMAFVAMIYPLEYMFPVIPLLPSCMSSAEQLLLAPTPFIIGLPSSFFKFRINFTLPNDVWIVDLDTNKVKRPSNVEDLPPLPDHEGHILVQNLQKILDSMSKGVDATISDTTQQQVSTPNKLSAYHQTATTVRPRFNHGQGQSSMPSTPFKSRRSSVVAGQLLQFAANKLSGSSVINMSDKPSKPSPSSSNMSSFAAPSVPTFNPLDIISDDVDVVDVAVRIAMVNFFNSQEVLANFVEHTRTIRLYPRPVVSFQKSSFIQSRTKISPFLLKLVETQSVEYLAEWALCPDNEAFQRIQTGVYDPIRIGDKPKWYGNQLESLCYQISDNENKEFYEEIARLIKDSSGISGAASSVGKFSDYYDDNSDTRTHDNNACQSDDDLDENNNNLLEPNHQIGRESLASYDVNIIDEDRSQSSYMSSNIPSPTDSTKLDTNCSEKHSADGGSRALSLNDVMNMQMRKSSLSSSTSSNGSWDESRMMQSIPANYQHDIGRFPPIRCDINQHFKPCNKLIHSLHEARKWLGMATAESGQEDNSRGYEFEARISFDSSTDENEDSLKNVPDSSSCDESGTEEFNFGGLHPVKVSGNPDETPEILNEVGEVKLFESVDSDTIIPSQSVGDNSNTQTDENNNVFESGKIQKTQDNSMDDNISINSGCDQLSSQQHSAETNEQTRENDQSPQQQTPQTPKIPPMGISSTSDTLSAILSSQKMRVSTGMAKLIDRASSISESKFLKQGSQSSAGGSERSPFFDRFTSEARDAVKEAKAAIDAGKNALKTTAMPAADAGRQKLLKNLQNLGEGLFEDRRDSVSMIKNDDVGTPTYRGEFDQQTCQVPLKPAIKGTDFNEIAGRANSMISGWLGSKATGFANRMRDRARPLGPFPSSKYSSCFYCDYLPPKESKSFVCSSQTFHSPAMLISILC